MDVLDGELVDDNEGAGPFRPPRERPEFPELGWESSCSSLPTDLSLGAIISHLRACGKQAHVKKPSTRGFNFFYWSYIHGVKCKEVDVVFYLRSKCWASQAKKESYTLECVLEPSVSTYLISVRYAHCTCTAGVAGSCHHLVALLLSVKHCAKKQQDAPEEQTCTTAPQRWEQPFKKTGHTIEQISPQPLNSLIVYG